MMLADTVRAALQQSGAFSLRAEARARWDEVAGLEHTLAAANERIPWWHRAAFFHATAEERQAQAVRTELEAARGRFEEANARWEQAFGRIGQQLPPVALVHQLECTVRTIVADRQLARTHGRGEGCARDLAALAEQILSSYAPQLSLFELAESLHDDDARRAAAASPAAGAARQDERLGWAPIDAQLLFAQAAASLEASGALVTARATLAREQHEAKVMAAHLEQARAQVSDWDKLIPGKSESQQRVAYLEGALSKEEHDVVQAIEALQLAVVRALSVHPPVWLALSCMAASSAIVAANVAQQESQLSPQTGKPVAVPSAHGRAVVLACLVEARRACEATFPGVAELLWPRNPEQAAQQRSDRSVGPYRVAGFVGAPAPTPLLGDRQAAALFQQLEQAQIRDHLSWAVAHASILPLIGRNLGEVKRRIGWLDRLVFWSDTSDESSEQALERRRRWHQGLMDGRASHCRRLVEAAARSHPMLGLGQAAAYAHTAVDHITTPGGSSNSPRHCPVENREPARNALQQSLYHIEQHFALRGNYSQLLDAVADSLRQGNQRAPVPEQDVRHYQQVIDRVAAQLPRDQFVPLYDATLRANQQLRASRAGQQHAAGQVSIWDRLNIFTDTDAEKARDAYAAQADQQQAQLQPLQHQLLAGFNQALGAYPPASVYFGAQAALSAVDSISAHSQRRTSSRKVGNSTVTSTYYVCVLSGKSAAKSAAHQWTQSIVNTFGVPPTASELLCDWIEREL